MSGPIAFALVPRVFMDALEQSRGNLVSGSRLSDEVRGILGATYNAGLQELFDRLDQALQRHLDGHSPRRLPIDASDSDLVLEDLRSLRRGEPLRFAQLEATTDRSTYVAAYRVRGDHHKLVSAALVPLLAGPAVIERLQATRSGYGEDYMVPAEAQQLWTELLQQAAVDAGDVTLEHATAIAGDGSGRALPALEGGRPREATAWIEIDCPSCRIDYDYPDRDGIPAWPRICPCGHVYSRSELREFGQHFLANGVPSGLLPPTIDQNGALEAARRLRAGEPLGACPQNVILELLQLVQLAAAEPHPPRLDPPRRRPRHTPGSHAKRARIERLQAAEDERARREAISETDSPHTAAFPGREATT
jgi:hypothetical protein